MALRLADCKTDVAYLIPTIPDDPKDWSDETEKALDDFFEHRFFFFDHRNKITHLKQEGRKVLAKRIEKLMEAYPVLTSNLPRDFKSRTFMRRFRQMLDGHPCSLLAIVYAKRVLSAIANHSKPEIRNQLIIQEEKNYAGKGFVLAKGCIYPSLYAPNRKRFEEIRDEIRRHLQATQTNISDLVFNANGKGPNYFNLIKNGAGKTTRKLTIKIDGEQDRVVDQEWITLYRITKHKAADLHARLSVFCDAVGIACAELDELFSDGRGDKPFPTGGANYSVAMPPKLGNHLHRNYRADR